MKWTKEKILSAILQRNINGDKLNSRTVRKENSSLYNAANIMFGSWKMAIETSSLDYSQICKTHFYNKEDMQVFASQKNGEFLSDKYINSETKHSWKCKNPNHPPFNATWNTVKQNHWCPKCGIEKVSNAIRTATVESANVFAEKRGGKCLSNKIKNVNTKLKWQCKEGHIWHSTYDSIIRGHWCKDCYYKSKRSLTIEDIKEFIKEKYNGELISESWVGSTEGGMKYKCSNGHIFTAYWNNVKNGHWCSKCCRGIAEDRCRFIFEKLTNKEFPSTRKILHGLEIDGYCEELKIGFEYNGMQHYRFIKRFHKVIEKFEKQKERDSKKIELCNSMGIRLIVIPYTIDDFGKLTEYIKAKLLSLNVKCISEEICLVDFNPKSRFKLEQCRQYAERRGGKLLSDVYGGYSEKLAWQCKNGHTWNRSWRNIKKRKNWCPFCKAPTGPIDKQTKKARLTELQNIAKNKNGCLLSSEYLGVDMKYFWKCNQCNDVWEATAYHVKNRGQWCPKCVGDRISEKKIEYYKKIKNASPH